MPRILLLGRNGQVGRELQRSLASLGELTSWGRQEADLADLAALEARVLGHAPDIIVNAAAYTAVDKAETDQAAAFRVNAEAVAVLARIAAALEAWLVHYSTDYVFDGKASAPYVETDPAAPASVYGASKLAGEEAVRRSNCRHLIFRTSWVYGADGGTFAQAILRFARERESLEVVADQTGAPTGADLIADVTAQCLRRLMSDRTLAASASGTYNLVAAGRTSRHEYARYLVDQAIALKAPLKTLPERVLPIATSADGRGARRPANSQLDTARLERTFGISLPDWKPGVRKLIENLAARSFT